MPTTVCGTTAAARRWCSVAIDCRLASSCTQHAAHPAYLLLQRDRMHQQRRLLAYTLNTLSVPSSKLWLAFTQSLAKEVPTKACSSSQPHRRRSPHTCSVSGLDRQPPKHHHNLRQLPVTQVTSHLTSSFLPIQQTTQQRHRHHRPTTLLLPASNHTCNPLIQASTLLSSTPSLSRTPNLFRIRSLSAFDTSSFCSTTHSSSGPKPLASHIALTSSEKLRITAADGPAISLVPTAGPTFATPHCLPSS